MKKPLYLFLFVACLGLPAIAQVEKGRTMIGGFINYSGQKIENKDTTGKVTQRQTNNNLGLGLRGGYFLANNFLMGLTFSIGSGTNKAENFNTAPMRSVNTTKNNNTSFGVFGRLYKMIGTSKFAVFGQLGLSYSMGNSSSETETVSFTNVTTTTKSKGDSNGLNILLQPGITYFLTRTVAVETYFGNVGYSMSTNKNYDNNGKLVNESGNSGLTTALNFNLSNIWLGVNFYFGGSKDNNSK